MSDISEGIDPLAVPSGTGCVECLAAVIITSFEAGEDWFWNYRTEKPFYGPGLAPPRSRPLDQPIPGPKGRVPADWEDYLNE
jgi:hypothetical protein